MGVASVSEAYFVFAIGLLLALNSGYINGLFLSGLLAEEGSDKVNVSAVTRAYTESGLNLVSGLYNEFGFAFKIILSFVAGACVSGLLNPEATPHKLVPSYGPTFLIGSICLIAALFAADIKPSGHAQYYLAAAANGLQNGISSIYSANLIRTSHHTGTSTDIGIIIGQILRGNWKNYWKLKVLIGLASSFWFGGLISFYSATAFLHDSLWFSTALFMVIGMSHLTFVVLTEKVSYFQAAYGTWKWEVVLLKVASTINETSDESNAISTLTEDQIDFVFDEIDAGGSGTINADELKSALEKMGKRLTRKNVLAMMAVVDLDDDGGINRQVFRTLVSVAALRSSQRQQRGQSSLLRSISSLSFGEDTSLSTNPLSRSASATFGMPLFVGNYGLIKRRPSDPTLSSTRPVFRSISATCGMPLFLVGTKSIQSLDQLDWMPEHLPSTTNDNNRTTSSNAKEEKKEDTLLLVCRHFEDHDEEDPVTLHSLPEDDDDSSYATLPPRLTYQEYQHHPPSGGSGDTAHAIILTDAKYPYAIVDIKELSGTVQQSISNLIKCHKKNLDKLSHAIYHDIEGASVNRKEDMMSHNLLNRGRLFDTRKVGQAGEDSFHVWTLTNIGQLGVDNMTSAEDSEFDEQDVLSI